MKLLDSLRLQRTFRRLFETTYLISLFALAGPRQGVAQPFPLLEFPIQGDTPYTAPMTVVMDHSGGSRFFILNDSTIVAYTGELAEGSSFLCDPVGLEACHANGNYIGVPDAEVLEYDGHNGYDYQYASPTMIRAPAAGRLYIPARDWINRRDRDPWCIFHTVYLDHGNGRTTWYLHIDGELLLANAPEPHSCPPPPGPQPSPFLTEDLYLGFVPKGEPFATVSNYYGEGSLGQHLHMDARTCDLEEGANRIDHYTCKVIDLYGWEWHSDDPLGARRENGQPIAQVVLEPLWQGFTRPTINSVDLAPIGGGYEATIMGSGFQAGSVVTLWDRNAQYLDENSYTFVPSLQTTSLIEVDLLIGARPPDEFVLKVHAAQSPRSRGHLLENPGVPDPSGAIGLGLIGDPAPDGGAFTEFQAIYDATDGGDAYFAGLTTLGADVFLYSEGTISLARAANGDDVGPLRVNDSGDMAYILDEGQSPGLNPMNVLFSGSVTPIRIATPGEAVPGFPTLEYLSTATPGAVAPDGSVAFSAGVLDTTIPFGEPMLLVYRADLGLIEIPVTDDDPAPGGGTFDLSNPATMGVTWDGDVVFSSSVIGGSSPHGIFLVNVDTGLVTKLVAEGDPSLLVGGTFGPPILGTVSERMVSFRATINGGVTDEAIFLIPDVSSPDTMVLVASEGQATGTDLGGTFSLPGNPPDNFPFGLGRPPRLRADGKVLFYSRLDGAILPGSGAPTEEGLFLWSGSGFDRVVATGETLSNGEQITDLSWNHYERCDSGLTFFHYRINQ